MKINGDWWNKKGQKHSDIFSIVENLQARAKARIESEKRYARLYSNRNILGLEAFNYYRTDPRSPPEEDRIRLNVCSALVDTVTSKLAIEQPRVVALLNSADFDVRSKAKDLQKFIDGVLESSGSYVEMLKAFRDAAIMGTGVVKVLDEWGNIKVERIPKHEINIDEEEAFYGCMSQLHQTKTVSRAKLLELYPNKAKEIKQASRVSSERIPTSEMSDLITIVMSWHLPSSPEAKDGRYVLSVDTGDIIDEPYKSKDFPFVFIKWKEPIFGFWGTGIIEEIQSLQLEINRLLMSAQKAMRAASNPMIFVPAGSSMSKMHISNEIGAIIPFVGSPPVVRVHQTVHPEIFNQIENLYRKCFELIGVSQLSATGRKPEGVNAAVAMRELQDIESERFSTIQRTYNLGFVGIATKAVALARALYAEDEADTKLFIKDKKFLSTINWSSIDLEEDQFSLDLDTANKLPLTRAGRINTITEWYQAELISTDEWRSLINMPDIQEESELRDAPKEYIREVIYRILFFGDLMLPEDHDDLEFAYKYSIMSYQRAKLDKYPDDRIELLSQYISAVEFKLKALEQPAPPEQQALPPGPAAPPMPQEAALPPTAVPPVPPPV